MISQSDRHIYTINQSIPNHSMTYWQHVKMQRIENENDFGQSSRCGCAFEKAARRPLETSPGAAVLQFHLRSECSVRTCQKIQLQPAWRILIWTFHIWTFFIFVSCEVWGSLCSISSESERTSQPITALTTASYLPKLIFGSLPQKMLSIRSYGGNQTESPQWISHLHDCLILNSGLCVKSITMPGLTRLHTIIRFSKPAAKRGDFIWFFFKLHQGLGNDFVACLFQKDKVFPLHFKAQACACCICSNEFYTLSSL